MMLVLLCIIVDLTTTLCKLGHMLVFSSYSYSWRTILILITTSEFVSKSTNRFVLEILCAEPTDLGIILDSSDTARSKWREVCKVQFLYPKILAPNWESNTVYINYHIVRIVLVISVLFFERLWIFSFFFRNFLLCFYLFPFKICTGRLEQVMMRLSVMSSISRKTGR